MNFNIVESHNYYYDKFEEWIEEYNKGTLQKDILKKLCINNVKHRNYLKKAIDEGRVIPRRKLIKDNAKYYSQTQSGNYIIIHRDEETNKMKTYGTYNSVNEVETRVNELKKNNWKTI